VWASGTKVVAGGENDYILIRDEKASGVQSGTFAKDAWRHRDINTVVSDNGGHAAVADNQITLVAGTYRYCITVPAYGSNQHKARLYNVTDTEVIEYGTSEMSEGTDEPIDVNTVSFIKGKFTIADTKVLKIEHYGLYTCVNHGFGARSGFTGAIEIYTVAEFWKTA